jgi:hypothetical protein
MTTCTLHESGAVELYFYGELEGADRQSMDAHLTACAECRDALAELTLIRTVLAARPDVCAPPAGDWSGFMSRLDRAVNRGTVANPRRPHPAWIAMAALLALVTMSVLFVAREREQAGVKTAGLKPGPTYDGQAAEAGLKPGPTMAPGSTGVLKPGPTDDDPALVELSEEHFERSKLVVLGLATKDAETPQDGWNYERRQASSLLNDTRLYRMAAEDRGMRTLAGVLRDLEIVLLQTSLAEGDDPEALGQIQRLIRKRDLVQKMEVVGTTGI